MNKWLIGCGVCVLTLAASTRGALAQEVTFGRPGQVVVGVERLTGVHRERLTLKESEPDPVNPAQIDSTESSYTSTTFAMLGMSSGISDSISGGPSTTPRLGVDAFVAPGFSVGGSLMYMTTSGKINSTTTAGATTVGAPERDQPSPSLLILNPRLGYAIPVGPELAIWPRAGFSFSRYAIHTERTDTVTGAKTTTDTSMTLSNVALDVMLAIQPVPHFAILVGPYADIGVGGNVHSERTPAAGTPQPDEEAKYTALGLSAGIGGVF